MTAASPTAFSTCDFCDVHKGDTSGAFRVLPPVFLALGGVAAFWGPVSTVKCHEDNTQVKAAVESPGEGRVLVVDGGGSLRCALVGDQIAELAVKNQWAGIVVYGCIRDSVAINALPIGVRALDTHPLKSIKKGVGDVEIPVTFGGVTFTPGDWLYADEDGVIVSAQALV